MHTQRGSAHTDRAAAAQEQVSAFFQDTVEQRAGTHLRDLGLEAKGFRSGRHGGVTEKLLQLRVLLYCQTSWCRVSLYSTSSQALCWPWFLPMQTYRGLR